MTFEQGDLKEMRVQAILMSGGRELQTEGTAKKSVITVVPKSKGESGRTRMEGRGKGRKNERGQLGKEKEKQSRAEALFNRGQGGEEESAKEVKRAASEAVRSLGK